MSISAPALSQAHQEPVTVLVIEPRRGLAALRLGELWAYRELLGFLAWRDVKVRYKQTALGVLWIVLQPVVSMLVFSGLFGGLLNVPSNGEPYPIFAFAALLPWMYFSGSLSRVASSMVGSAHLITKVYFPRLIIPISCVLAGLVDLAVSMGVLAVLMLFFQTDFTWRLLLLPVFVLLAMLTALGFGLWLSALNVRYRDINYVVPFLIQVWMYLTPVIYASSMVPENLRWLLALNPMATVVEGFRWAVLGPAGLDGGLTAPQIAVSLMVLLAVTISGLAYFKTMERSFADEV